ncbi:hypothetical protein [Sphaerisporangium sp. NPDC051011]|uniref:hypothetical protein n=1 Tax=Sphaerisporangium sp. NPDC051011 TaxID=3155792 RepID=UPI0033C0E342
MEFLIGAVVLAVILFFLVPTDRPKRRTPSAGSLIVGGIVAGAAIAAVFAVIAWRDVLAWFQPRMNEGDIGELIRNKLDSGDYAKASLKGEIRDARDGTLKYSKTWEGTLDDDLKRRFGNSDKITIAG